MFDESRPIFLQLADQIADDILRGIYAEGDQVPSTNEFAAFMRINPATAGKALNLLVDRDVLYKRRGIGMFVADGAKARIASQRRDQFVTAYVAPLWREAKTLGLTPAEVIDLVSTSKSATETAPAPVQGTAEPTEFTPAQTQGEVEVTERTPAPRQGAAEPAPDPH